MLPEELQHGLHVLPVVINAKKSFHGCIPVLSPDSHYTVPYGGNSGARHSWRSAFRKGYHDDRAALFIVDGENPSFQFTPSRQQKYRYRCQYTLTGIMTKGDFSGNIIIFHLRTWLRDVICTTER
jgi:hypothetical protein